MKCLSRAAKPWNNILFKLVGEHPENKYLNDLVNLPQVQALRPIRYKGFLSIFSSATEPKKLEKIPVATLVDAYFDIAGFTSKKEMDLLQMAELVDKLPEFRWKKGVYQLDQPRRNQYRRSEDAHHCLFYGTD